VIFSWRWRRQARGPLGLQMQSNE